MQRSLHFLILISLLMSACSSSLAQPSSQVGIKQEATHPLRSETFTLPIPTILTNTPAPITTNTSTIIATETERPTPEITRRPTQPGEAKFTKTAWYRGNSPDLKWFWIVEEAPSMDYFVTHLVNADGSMEWLIHPEAGKTGWQQATYLPVFWLPNDPYVYMTGHGCCGDGPATHYTDRSLVRLNLETGQLSMLLSWKNGKGSYSISFSPDGKYLLWSAWGEHSVHILQLKNGNEKVVLLPEKYLDIGGWWENPQQGWSTNGKRVVQEIYMACEPGSDVYCFKVAFVVIEPGTGGYQIIENDITQTIGVNNQWDYKIFWTDNENITLSVGTNLISQKVNIPAPSH